MHLIRRPGQGVHDHLEGHHHGEYAQVVTILLTRLPTREMYHAAMDVHSRISAVEVMVMKKL